MTETNGTVLMSSLPFMGKHPGLFLNDVCQFPYLPYWPDSRWGGR